jgi:hypothetical protein
MTLYFIPKTILMEKYPIWVIVYLNDAHRVVESLVAALPVEDIKAKVGLLYRGYYMKVIKELKAIMERRTS